MHIKRGRLPQCVHSITTFGTRSISSHSLTSEGREMEGELHVLENVELHVLENVELHVLENVEMEMRRTLCTICQHTQDPQCVILYCNHTFCHCCFRAFLQSGGNKCPNCRAIITEYLVISSEGVWEGNAGFIYPEIIEL